MKKNLSLIVLLVFANLLFADEPPCWCEFSINSPDFSYQAKIGFQSDEDAELEAWDRKWSIKVYKTSPDTLLDWESKFHHDGYGNGKLSEDGQVFSYANVWLKMDEDPPRQVFIYTPNKILRFSGKDLNLNPEKLPHTVSHQIWMKGYQLIPNRLTDSSYLKITTLNKKEIKLALNETIVEGKLSKSTELKTNKEGKQRKGLGAVILFAGAVFLRIFYKYSGSK